MKSSKGHPLLLLLLHLILLQTPFSPPGEVSALKINKNTVEMLNNGLRALLSIKRILSTLKSVNELTGQAFPHLLASGTSSLVGGSSSSSLSGSPKMRLVSKIFGSGGGSSGGASGGSAGSGKSPLSTASLVEGMAAAVQGKRSNSLGLIKIGEKPPPGLFPETLPYSINGAGVPTSAGSELPGTSGTAAVAPSADLLNAVSALTSGSNSNSNNLPFSTSELFSKLVAAASASAASQQQQQSSNFDSDSESLAALGSSGTGGSTSQLIPHFSASDLKTSSSDVNTRFNLLQPPSGPAGSTLLKKAFFPRRLMLSITHTPSSQTVHSNIFNHHSNGNGNDQQSFEGTFEVLPN